MTNDAEDYELSKSEHGSECVDAEEYVTMNRDDIPKGCDRKDDSVFKSENQV